MQTLSLFDALVADGYATSPARPPAIRLYEDEACADLFAGGGGTSTGIEAAIGRSPDVAINHDREALAMHRVNHPKTKHYCENVYDVAPRKAMRGKKCGFAWFSPDCTFHSKARGGKPFRDPNRARRIRGLVGIALKWAAEVRPRIIFIENVEEIEHWCPLGPDGRPDWRRRGESFRRWVARLRNRGYTVEWRQLRASDYGAPTIRKRLFIIARCDGRPIVWPEPTHGPRGSAPLRTAAECIDFSLPVPSIFFTPKEARAWAAAMSKLTGKRVAPPKRPLALATKRRIARGVHRFVLETPDPFIVPAGREFLVNTRHADDRIYTTQEPLRTIPASDREIALVIPTLINTRNGERKGQAPRVLDITQPFTTVTAHGSQGALVAAFLAKHNAGHEATGQTLREPTHTLTTRDSKAIVTSHLLHLRGGLADHHNTSQDVRSPAPTLTAGGTHVAEVRAFLVKFFGSKKDGRPLTAPLDTLTTKDRFGLVTVTIGGEEYALVDIGMRMLTPRELFRCQGFPLTYEIHEGKDHRGRAVKLTKKAQTRLVGNSVPPQLAAAIIAANLADEARTVPAGEAVA